MKIYYIDQGNDQGMLVAVHEDSQDISPSIYGDNVKVLTVAGLEDLKRIGPTPPADQFDTRPIIISSSSESDADILQGIKNNAVKSILAAINTVADSLTQKYPEHERLSWGTKQEAANNYLAGKDLTDTQKAMLEAEQNTGGYASLEDLCNTVIANAAAFMKVSGALAGIRASYTTEINNATSEDAVKTIMEDFTKRLQAVTSA
jgi:hypothetical protein